MNNLISFGGRSAAFEKGLKNNAIIKTDNELILIDVSQENFAYYRDIGLFDSIETIHVVITHTHGDHISGLGDLVLYSYYSILPMFVKKTNIYVPSEIYDDVYKLMQIYGCEESQFNLFDICNGTNINSISFYPVEVSHVIPLRCFGYIIEMYGYRVYYSGDSNMIPDYILEELLTNQFDLFYQDTCIAEYTGNVHLSLNLLCELIPDYCRNKVYCMHLDKNFPIDYVESLGFNVIETII